MKKILKKSITCIILLTALNLFSCQIMTTNDNELTTNSTRDDASASDSAINNDTVYMAGTVNMDGFTMPAYWVDGVRHDLDSGNSQGYAEEIVKDGDDIYIVGYLITTDIDENETYTACYWKNEVRTDIYEYYLPLVVTDIAIENNKIYICGYIRLEAYSYRTFQYADGVVSILDENSTTVSLDSEEITLSSEMLSRAYTIMVDGSDIYVGGYIQNEYDGRACNKPCYWKNGVLNYLNYDNNRYFSELRTRTYTYNETDNKTTITTVWENIGYITDDVYTETETIEESGDKRSGLTEGTVSGTSEEPEFIYKYTTVTTFNADGSVTEVTTSTDNMVIRGNIYKIKKYGSDIYFIGYNYNLYQQDSGLYKVPSYWKNSELVELPAAADSGIAFDLLINGDNVYVSGECETASGNLEVPVMWKNGKRSDLEKIAPVAVSTYAVEKTNNGVYVIGYLDNGVMRNAGYWLNGERVNYYDDYKATIYDGFVIAGE